MNLRVRFGLVIGVLVLAVVSATTGILYWTEKSFLLKETLNKEEQTLRSLGQVARESHLSQDDLMLINYVGNLQAKNPDILFAYVAAPGPKGEPLVLAHTIKDLSGVPLAVVPAPPAGTRVLRELVPFGPDGTAEAVLGISQDKVLVSIDAALERTRRRIALVAAVMVLAGLAASAVLAFSLTRPISRLAAGAALLGQGKLGTRIDAEGSDEIARLAREFNAMAAKLERLDEMKRDFVSAVTHELKSPLAAIDSYLELILHESKKERDPRKWLEDVATLRTHTERLSRFVTDLLDLAKIEKAQFTVAKAPMDLAAAARDVARFLAPLAEKNRVSLRGPRDAERLPPVSADAELIRQVMVNLVSNALKFTPEGGRVTLSAERSNGALLCSVSDTGIGIRPEDLGRIFDKFEQVKEARASARGPKGTGLGLAICKAIIDSHEGRIWAESSPGKGSRFCFSLPIKEP